MRGAFRIMLACFVGEEQISTLSILCLLPQFALIAAAEAFIYPVGGRCVGVDIEQKPHASNRKEKMKKGGFEHVENHDIWGFCLIICIGTPVNVVFQEGWQSAGKAWQVNQPMVIDCFLL